QARLWQQESLPAVRMAVNLSGYQLQHRDFVQTVEKVLDQVGLPGDLLEVEVTETVIMQNPDFVVALLNQLRELGIHISIDDFGTGYSSLAHLKRFSVNTLKIDKSFIRDVENNVTDAAIASAIIAMGNSLNLRVIAEGVETVGQLTFLKNQRCDEIQGYLFSHPLEPEAAAEFLRRNHSGAVSPEQLS
ncbi:MAG: EAL domain-containing protein, partial [Desulfuromonadaceae bacterium]